MMIDFLSYLIKVSGIFAILYLLYLIGFSRLTFHKLNRACLISILPLSLILPVLKIEIGSNIPVSKTLPLLFNEFETMKENVNQASPLNHFELNISKLIFVIYSLIFLLFLGRFLLNIFRLIQIKRQSTIQFIGKYTVIRARITSAFSFFNWIFLPQNTDGEIAKHIIEHEKQHGNYYHTIDLILVELFAALFWFNPLVYLFRRNLKSVHEFQIDHILLKEHMKASDYLQLLLNNLQHTQKSVAFFNNFNGSTIEKRITMMTKTKSSGWKTARYTLLVPVIVFITMAFSDHSGNSYNIPDISPIKTGEAYKITSEYGKRMHPFTKEKTFHYGIDFAAQTGTPVVATANGVVTRVIFLEKTYGKLIEIDHRNRYSTRYAQLNDYAVKEGDKVEQGDVIGYIGQSGLSTGPHLHYEVFKDGKNVNPRNYITK